MKKIILFAVVFQFALFNLNAQNIGINATGAAPAASAGLDVNFTNKGLLVPRVALTALNAAGPIAAPATSLLVYNTATAGVAPNNVTPGYYYWGGAAWVRVSTGGDDWKITGNANTTFGTHFLGTTNAQGVDFRTNNIIRLRIPNANQVHANSNGTAALPFYSRSTDPNTGMYFSAADQLSWSTGGVERLRLRNVQLATTFNGTAATPAYSWTTDVNMGMYRIGTDILGFSTNGVERMRIIANGQVGINTPAPVVGDLVSTVAAAGREWAINGYNALTIGSSIYGEINNNTNVYSTIEGFKTGTPANGGGVFGIGYAFGTIGLANSGGTAYGGYFSTNFGDFAYVGGWNGASRKIIGVGTVGTIINDLNNNRVSMCAPEAPEVLFMDYGVGQLSGGRTHIEIDPILAKNLHVDKNHPIKIFVQLEGDCNGVYVTNKSATGFDVIELNGGTSNVSFSWSLVGNRANEVYSYSNGTTRVSDYASERFNPAPPYIKPKTKSGIENEIQVESITTSSVNN
ncbi:MAG: hypothetical protein K0B10_03495 [Vicingaceae bacterium]|nr:hypothetical protein [Vicingaceae bacterium]